MESSLPSNPDVIIVGAGTAGLAAGRALVEAGRPVLVLEAAPTVGGRCITDTATFGVPFDRGGSWLHSASINPLVPVAEREGFSIHKKEWSFGSVLIGDRTHGADEMDSYNRYHQSMWAAIREAGERGRDVPIADVLPDGAWRDTARHWIAEHLSVDADRASTGDVAAGDEGEGDWLLAEGYGTLIARIGTGVPVRLNCSVTEIDWSGHRIAVTTSDGTIEADKVVVTVSVGVLASGAIQFTPRLPDRKRAAINNLQMGLLNKVGILFSELPAPPHTIVDYHPGGEAFSTIHFGFCGSNLTVGFTAGRFGEALEADGPGATTAFVREGLRDIYGSGIDSQILGTDETAWMSHPLTRGSYSAAMPGKARARTDLVEPIDDRIFFAGEATISRAYASVHGAYLSGLDTVQRIVSPHRHQD